MTIDELNVVITAQNSDFNRRINEVNARISDLTARTESSSRRISGLFSRMGSIVSKALAATGLTMFGRQAVELASDLQEVQNVVDTSFGDMAYAAENFADTAIESFGISELAAKRTSSTYMAMAKGAGIADQQAAQMAITLTKLSADVASFYNISQELADIKLKSIFTGETETLKDLGVVMTQANLQQYAYANGIQTSVTKMSQAEKIALQYNFVLDHLSLAQGDFARTSNSWANQTRVLSERWKEFMSIIGSGLIQVLTPAVQFLNNVLSNLIIFAKAAVQVVSELFGMGGSSGTQSLVSNGSSGSSFMGGIADDTYAASDAQKELASNTKSAGDAAKKAVLGFDELNILSKNDSSSVDSENLGGVGDLDLSTPYGDDFDAKTDSMEAKVKKLADKIKKAVKGIMTVLKKVSPVLKGIATALLAIKGLKFLKSLASSNKIVKTLLSVFKSLFKSLKSGKGIVGTLKAGWDKFRTSMSNLSAFQKATISIAGLSLEAVTVYSAIKDLTLGNINLGDALLNIIPVCGLVGTAMYGMFGPIGLVATALVGVASALAGYASAQQEILDTLVNEAFYDGVGTSITDIANQFEALTQQIVDSNQPILDNKENIDSAKQSIDQTCQSIGAIESGISLGLYTAEEKIPKLTTLFEQLKTDTKNVMDDVYDNVVWAMSGSLGDALEQAGAPMGEYMAMLSKIKGEADSTYTDLTIKADNLKASYEDGTISYQEYVDGLNGVLEDMGKLTSTQDAVTSFVDETSRLLDNINWEDEDAQNNAFTKLSESGDNAKLSINDSCDAIKKSLETMKGWTDDPAYQLKIDELIGLNEKSRENQLAKIDEELSAIFDGMQIDLIQKSQGVKDAAVEEWNSMDWFAQWWNGGSEEAYVNKALGNYQNNIVGPVSQKIEDTMGGLGVDGSTWAGDAMNNVINALFDTTTIHSELSGGSTVYKYRTTLSEAISDALAQVGKDGKTAAEKEAPSITQGLANGISNNIDVPDAAIKECGSSIITTFKNEVDSHSPSRVFEQEGSNIMWGIRNGISGNFALVDNSFRSLINTLLSRMETFVNRCRTALNSMLSDFSSSMRSVSISSSGTVSYRAISYDTIPRLAKGGVAYQDTLAMIGEGKDREAVLPLNSQVYREIASGIDAERSRKDDRILDRLARIEQAIKDYSGGDLYMDTEKVGERLDRRSAARNRRYGQPVTV